LRRPARIATVCGGRLEMATRHKTLDDDAGRLFEKTLERGPQPSAIISPYCTIADVPTTAPSYA